MLLEDSEFEATLRQAMRRGRFGGDSIDEQGRTGLLRPVKVRSGTLRLLLTREANGHRDPGAFMKEEATVCERPV